MLFSRTDSELNITFPNLFAGPTEESGYVVLHGVLKKWVGCWKFSLCATLFTEQVSSFIRSWEVHKGVSVSTMKNPIFPNRGKSLFKNSGLSRALGQRYLFFSGEFQLRTTDSPTILYLLRRMGRDFSSRLLLACDNIGLERPTKLCWGEGFMNSTHGGPRKYDFRKTYDCDLFHYGAFTVPFNDRFRFMLYMNGVPTNSPQNSSLLFFYAYLEPILDKLCLEVPLTHRQHFLLHEYDDITDYNVSGQGVDVGLMDVNLVKRKLNKNDVPFVYCDRYSTTFVTEFTFRLNRDWFPFIRLSFSKVYVMVYDFQDRSFPDTHGDYNFLPISSDHWGFGHLSGGADNRIKSNLAAYNMLSNDMDSTVFGSEAAAFHFVVEMKDQYTDTFNVKREVLLKSTSKGIKEAIISLIAEANVDCMRKSLENWLMDDRKGRFSDLNFVDKLWKVMHKQPTYQIVDNYKVPNDREWENYSPPKQKVKWDCRSVDTVLGRNNKRYVCKKEKGRKANDSKSSVLKW